MPDDANMHHAPTDSDLLHGAEAIAAFIRVPRRRAFHLLETGALPAFKLGARWTARKSTLLAHFEKLEEAATAT